MVSKTILITGASGFIGHHLVNYFLKETHWNVIALCRDSYAGYSKRFLEILEPLENYKDRFKIVYKDLSTPLNNYAKQEIGTPDYILHLAAISHVDTSITHPVETIQNNINATLHLLEYIRNFSPVSQLLYFSTDEVFGPASFIPTKSVDYEVNNGQSDFTKKNGFTYYEWSRYNSSNPYAASKAAGEELINAYVNTYDLQAYITHTMNVFGERQHPEKFIPKCITKILNDEVLTIHGTQEDKSGSRFYIHANKVAEAIMFLLCTAVQGEKYNIVGEKEVTNLELAQLIASYIGKKLDYEIVDFHSSRPGHDLRYALNGLKLHSMGFTIQSNTFERTMEETVEWYLNNPHWLGKINDLMDETQIKN